MIEEISPRNTLAGMTRTFRVLLVALCALVIYAVSMFAGAAAHLFAPSVVVMSVAFTIYFYETVIAAKER